MPHPASLAVAFLACAACARTENGGGTVADSARVAAPSPSTTDSTSPSASGDSRAWVLAPFGIGAIRVGMTADELRAVAGQVELPASPGSCVYVHPGAAPPGVLVMLADGRVARIDVDSAGVRTTEGITIGDSAARVVAAYGTRVTTLPHKYVPGGQYLTVAPAIPGDSTRLVFETEAGRVRRMRSGRLPEVSWVERCG